MKFSKTKNGKDESGNIVTRREKLGDISLKKGLKKTKRPDKSKNKTPVGMDIAGLISKVRGRKNATMGAYKKKTGMA